MAYHHFSALFRRRRHLFRLCHGAHSGHSHSQVLSPGRPGHHPPSRHHGQGHAGHWLDRGLRLPDRSVSGFLQRRQVRNLHDDQPLPRALCPGLLDADFLQHHHSQLLWSRKVRRNVGLLFVLSLVVNTGMWLERFVIIVISLSRDFIPSSWGMYYPTRWDWATYIGTFGLFFTLFFLFIRFLPMISIVEVRSLVHETNEEQGHS